MDKIYTALGLMSGTSMDGLDASIIKSDGIREYSVEFNKYFEYGKELRLELENIRDKILSAVNLKEYSIKIKELEKKITLFHAHAVNEIINVTKTNIDLIGFHGHTIFHDSKKKISIQLGDGKLLSQLTKKIVVYEFRQNDLKNGGRGAPLAPIFHNTLVNKFLKKEFNHSNSIYVLNIGGIANITQTFKWKNNDNVFDFIKASDIGPGNCLLDKWIRINSDKNYDNEGKISSYGKTDILILNQALENFNIGPPYEESLDINDFDISFVKGLSLENGASTLTDFTASQISKALIYFNNFTNGVICLVCGGGRKNKHLIKKIKSFTNSKKIDLYPIENYGIDGDFVESQAFAYLAIRCILKLPISFPNTTGCKKPTIGGEIIKNF